MDTDDLSNEAYEGIIIESERFNHNLTLRFGVLSYDCKNEEVYLEKAISYIEDIKMPMKMNNVISFLIIFQI
jgi:hypothetical protein